MIKVFSANIILKKCSNRKFRKGFIKYLSTLDFQEFSELFDHYTKIFSKFMIRFNLINPKKFTKNWLKRRFLKHKFDSISIIFLEANRDFIIKINKELNYINLKTTNLLIEMEETNKTFSNSKLVYENIISSDPIIKENILSVKKILYVLILQ